MSTEPVPSAELQQNKQQDAVGWNVEDLSVALPEIAHVLPGTLAVLGGHGLIIDAARPNYPGHVGAAVWKITEQGENCLLLLDFRLHGENR